MLRFLFLFWLFLHPVHVSMTSIDYNPDQKAFNGFTRLNIDDLMLDCSKLGFKVERQNLLSINKELVSELEKYLNARLIFSVNGEPVECKVGNIRIEDHEVTVNIRFDYRKDPVKVGIKNLIMTGLYYDQTNMVIIKVGDFEEGFKLTSDIHERTFNIN